MLFHLEYKDIERDKETSKVSFSKKNTVEKYTRSKVNSWNFGISKLFWETDLVS